MAKVEASLPVSASFRGRAVLVMNYYANKFNRTRSEVIEALCLAYAEADKEFARDVERGLPAALFDSFDTTISSTKKVDEAARAELKKDAMAYIQEKRERAKK